MMVTMYGFKPLKEMTPEEGEAFIAEYRSYLDMIGAPVGPKKFTEMSPQDHIRRHERHMAAIEVHKRNQFVEEQLKIARVRRFGELLRQG